MDPHVAALAATMAGMTRGRALAALPALVLTLALSVLVSACTSAVGSDRGPTRTSATAPTTAPTSGTLGPLDLSLLAVGSSDHALEVGGRIRMYRAYRPATVRQPVSVVVMLHGGFGSAREAERAYGWNALADREGFVVVYPDAVGSTWNVGGDCCGIAASSGIDDVGFVERVLSDLATVVTYDRSRVYAVGFSTGGMMAYRLACDTTSFAAVGVVAGTLLGDCLNPAPVSVMHVHGTADTTIPFLGVGGMGVAEITGTPIPDIVTTWRNVDRCGGIVSRSQGAVTINAASCAAGRAVSLVTVDNGGHWWPGVIHSGPMDASPAPEIATPRPTSSALPTVGTPAPFDTTKALWDFLSAHVR